VVYGDRAFEAARLLSYTSDPLSEPLRVVGHPILRLYVSCSRDDGGLFAYLEDVGPDDRVTYITEGVLRLLHRRTGAAPYVSFGAPHSFLRADGAPLVPGEPELVELTLLPVSALIREGHRLRVSIAGHDAGTFRRYPADGPVELRIERSPQQVSALTLPYLP
jgi:putative CocE/NonD family hydrolase